jgi:hypothetical protein
MMSLPVLPVGLLGARHVIGASDSRILDKSASIVKDGTSTRAYGCDGDFRGCGCGVGDGDFRGCGCGAGDGDGDGGVFNPKIDDLVRWKETAGQWHTP